MTIRGGPATLPGIMTVTLLVTVAYGCGEANVRNDAAQAYVPAAEVPADAAPLRMDTAFIHVAPDSVIRVRVEIAERDDQRALGLMDRDSLDADAGMIFLYDEMQPGSAGFWMYRTRIPLDIAFLDGAGRIVAIRQMEPCPSAQPARCTEMARDYNPGVPYFGALEVNRGFFEEHGVETGASVVLPGRIGG